MSAIERIKEHFRSLGGKTIDVPEWGLVIHSTPVTLAERTKIYSGLKDDNDPELCLRILINKAKDEKGEPLFTSADKKELLLSSDASVLIRVCAEIMSSAAPPAAELKN